MLPLTYIPSLGFELMNCRETQISEEIAADKGIITAKDSFLNWKGRNICKLIGYLPLLGTIMALSRTINILSISKERMSNKFNWIARGAIEFLSLGFLLIIPDIIATLYRNYYMENDDKPLEGVFVDSNGNPQPLDAFDLTSPSAGCKGVKSIS